MQSDNSRPENSLNRVLDACVCPSWLYALCCSLPAIEMLQYAGLGQQDSVGHPGCCFMQVCAVLLYAQQNNVEPFLEPVLLLADALMARDAADMASGSSNGELLDKFMNQLMCFMDLCTHPDPAVAVSAAQCLAQLVSRRHV